MAVAAFGRVGAALAGAALAAAGLWPWYAAQRAESEALRRRLEALADRSVARALAAKFSRPSQAWRALQEEGRSFGCEELEPDCVAQGGWSLETKARLLDAAGDALASLRRFAAAKARHEAALAAKRRRLGRGGGAAATDLVTSYAALAMDDQNLFQPEEALKWLREAQALAPQLPKKALAVLYQQEAKIHECQEDYVSALFVFQHGLKIHRSEDPARRVVHMELLKQALAGDGVPPAVAASMQREAEDLARALVQGGHGRVGQFPRSFVPGLSARPWWPVEAELWDAGHPELPEVPWQSAALAEVRAAKDHLLQEYQDLKARDLLDTDRECIASSGEMWRSFQVEAPWRQETCEEASVTPVACRLLAALRGKEGGVAAPLLRGGYSAVAAKGRLRPHFGTSNAQLKWHLGLAIPSDGGKPCAWLRVGNETRAWREGEVLFFDDSFEHEVSNTCSEERVVFQLVFAHPDLQRHS
ncbi:unnamed protein product [Effrenium voratum]|nr:unnamed protein product [Effrenium voratum]